MKLSPSHEQKNKCPFLCNLSLLSLLDSKKDEKSACGNHTIRIDKLEEAVLTVIQNMVDVAIETEGILKKINANGNRKKESEHLKKAIETQTLEREKCKQMMVELYPDWKNGIITQEEYFLLKQSILDKMETLDNMIEHLTETAKSYETGISGENEFIAHFKKHGKIKCLTRPLLIELVDEILIHEGGGITVKFKFDDAYKEAMEYIEMNKDAIKTA